MRDEAIALWRKLEEKQERERAAMTALMQFAVEIDTPETIYDKLRRGLEMSNGIEAQRDHVLGATGVDFDPNAKPFMQ